MFLEAYFSLIRWKSRGHSQRLHGDFSSSWPEGQCQARTTQSSTNRTSSAFVKAVSYNFGKGLSGSLSNLALATAELYSSISNLILASISA